MSNHLSKILIMVQLLSSLGILGVAFWAGALDSKVAAHEKAIRDLAKMELKQERELGSVLSELRAIRHLIEGR